MKAFKELDIKYIVSSLENELGLWATDLRDGSRGYVRIGRDSKLQRLDDILLDLMGGFTPRYTLQLAYYNIELATGLWSEEGENLAMSPVDMILDNLSSLLRELVIDGEAFNRI